MSQEVPACGSASIVELRTALFVASSASNAEKDARVGRVLGVSGFGQFWVREIGVKKLLV